ncbi:MAG: hypothetical protein BAJALOKI2v1_240052 [Promethearchaeota archaeon]|nr:MAG: hypothetical protein BAJALOKI2v1_240052 [Candidatus Lokiarchaeota archaeon]
MVDFHRKNFYGQKTGLQITSPSKNVPFLFLGIIKKKEGAWEKPEMGEGKVVKLSLEEIICILDVLKKGSGSWRGYHVFKDYKTEIHVSWESEARQVIIFRVGDYEKKLRFPNTNLLTLLLDHILREKIQFATTGTYDTELKDGEKEDQEEYRVFSEQILARDGLQVIETTEHHLSEDIRDITAKILVESPKALLVNLSSGEEFWIPKSTVHSDYDPNNKKSFQKLAVDSWIIEKNKIF